MMARRALEAACADKGADKGMLGEKLGKLKAEGFLTGRLLEQADMLKVVGNAAAHGGPPISQEDAETTLRVMVRVLEELYDDEKILADIKAKHARKKS
jgi:hypothetical protein